MKKRKFRRTAKRRAAGRTMTVTTSSRVVKTTRMNPSKAKITDAYRKKFFTAYLVAALWSTNDESTPSGGEPLDSNYGIDDFDKDSLDVLRRDCNRFIDKYAPVLAAIDADGRETAEQAGHDFWLTRNGHGVGFQDRKLGAIGERLAKSVGWRTPFPEINLYVGDDGKIHTDVSTMRSNPRVSKTHVEFIIQGNYGYGWDDENTEMTPADAKRSLREYRENGPGSYRLIRRRVKNDATNPKRRRRPNPKGYGKTKYRGHVIEVTFFHGEVFNKAFWVASVSKDGRHIMDLDTTKSRPDAYKVARAFIDQRSNPGDSRSAETQRMPAVIRVSIPAGGKDPRSAETRRLKVITSAHRKNPGGGQWVLRRPVASHSPLSAGIPTEWEYLVGPGKQRTRDASKAAKFISKMGAQGRRLEWGLRGSAWSPWQMSASNPVRNLVVPRRMWKTLKKVDKRTKHGHRYVRCKTRRSRRAFWLPCTIR